MPARPSKAASVQITLEQSTNNLIRAWEPGRIRIGEQWLTGNLIVTADTIVSDWMPVNGPRIGIGDLGPALEIKPELVVVGAGAVALTPDTDLMAELAALGIGLEYMQTPAACRTYNVLVHEGRRVAAALIQNEPSSGAGQ
jgi:uncharacterized protein